MAIRDIKGSTSHVWSVLREKGVQHLVKSGVYKLTRMPFVMKAELGFYRIFLSHRRFVFNGQEYRYLYHMYNNTWKNERAVEVPIVWEIVRASQDKQILEVGNVLSHYYPVKHDIVDKFEKGEGVTNQDVVDFKSTKRYDLIVTISTLEHIGWDENPEAKSSVLAEPMKIFKAIENLKNHLAPNGKIVVTVPMGLNPQLDMSLKERRLVFEDQRCMKRISRNNRWKEVDWSECAEARYGSPYGLANAIVIGVTSNS